MKRRLLLGLCGTVLLGLLTDCVQASDAICTFDQMQTNAPSVIDPCTKRLGDTSQPEADRAEAFYVRGRAYARTGQTKLAAQDLDIAVKLAPTRSDILVSRATAEMKLGRMQDAWADLNRALTIDPRDARANRTMAQIFQSAGDYEEAVKLYNRCLEVDPREPYALLDRSTIRAAQHQFAEAMADASALVAIPPEVINKLGYVDANGRTLDFHAVALSYRADLYEQIGNPEAAKTDFDAALAESRTAMTLVARARFSLRMKRIDGALKDLDEAIQLDSHDGTTHYLRGLALIGLNRFQESLAAIDKAVELHKAAMITTEQAGFDLVMRARSLRGLGRTDEAVQSMEEAVEVSPEAKESTLLALSAAGYWTETEVPPAEAELFKAALRACMIDKDCN